MAIGLPDDKVDGISLELTSSCNLRCRLCAHNYDVAQRIKPNIMKSEEWIRIIDKYTNLTTVILAGILSEPTLYPYLKDLLVYFKERGLKVELYTNGNTHDSEWWSSLAEWFSEKDKVVFTVCGSTQELHEKYRVGSSLEQLLKNAESFRKASGNKKNDYCQHILFKYNEEDLRSGKMQPIFDQFSHILPINSLPYQERFHVIDGETDIKMIQKLSDGYNFIQNLAKTFKNKGVVTISCKNFGLRFLWLDSYGRVYPCFLYQLYCNDEFNSLDYSKILNYEYDFCYECEEHIAKLMKTLGIEQMG